jgi:hypothetical protein
MLFFMFAIKSWDTSDGEISTHKIWFLTLDEISTVLYFCLCSILASFWAELYYISVNAGYVYHESIKPMTWAMNVVALAGVPLCSYAVSRSDEAEASLVFVQYTVFIVMLFGFAACVFGYYAYLAATQLNLAPVELLSRRSSLFSLRMLGCVCIFALIAKALIYIILDGKAVSTGSLTSRISIVMYYFWLEMCPIISILLYYRVVEAEGLSDEEYDSVLKDTYGDFGWTLPVTTTTSIRENSVDENDSLLIRKQQNYGNYQSDESARSIAVKDGRPSTEPISSNIGNVSRYVSNPDKAAPGEVVDAVIASLSSSAPSSGSNASAQGSIAIAPAKARVSRK